VNFIDAVENLDSVNQRFLGLDLQIVKKWKLLLSMDTMQTSAQSISFYRSQLSSLKQKDAEPLQEYFNRIVVIAGRLANMKVHCDDDGLFGDSIAELLSIYYDSSVIAQSTCDRT
jgi:hypothetical protein